MLNAFFQGHGSFCFKEGDMRMEDYIYGMFFEEDNIKRYFYVGITDDFERRCREHKNNVRLEYVRGERKGQLKEGSYWEFTQAAEYHYIRTNLIPNNIKWSVELLETVNEENAETTEDVVMVKMIKEGHPLCNSKSGEKYARWLKIANSISEPITKKSVKKYHRHCMRVAAEERAKKHRERVLMKEEERKETDRKVAARTLYDARLLEQQKVNEKMYEMAKQRKRDKQVRDKKRREEPLSFSRLIKKRRKEKKKHREQVKPLLAAFVNRVAPYFEYDGNYWVMDITKIETISIEKWKSNISKILMCVPTHQWGEYISELIAVFEEIQIPKIKEK